MVRRRPSAATVIAVLALICALSGTAIAAKHYLITSESQIKPSVLRSLHGANGKRGPRGLPGPSGAPGATGAQGATGPAGPGAVALRFARHQDPAVAPVPTYTVGTVGSVTVSAQCVASGSNLPIITVSVAGPSDATVLHTASNEPDTGGSFTTTQTWHRLASDAPSSILSFSAASGHKTYGTSDVGYDDGTHVVTVHVYATVDATAQTCSVFGQGIP
jgi:hypothetical protein